MATGGLGSGLGTGGLGAGLPSVPVQDLSRDPLIANAPRTPLPGGLLPAPTLGGIPLLARLGQGGMGAVYYGVHPRLRIEVAVKVLPFHLAARNPELIQRFYREAQSAARVKSAHLVGVLDVNEECDVHYLVMEFVAGKSAGAYLREQLEAGAAGLPEGQALEICIAVCTGLSAAHASGIVHRDIKPDNILLPYRAQVHGAPSRGAAGGVIPDAAPGAARPLELSAAKLADLGLARIEDQGQTMSGSNQCLGTPGYLAPEQAADAKTAKKPADVFSLGATLYALLAGRAPFAGGSLLEVLDATRGRPHVPIRRLRAEVTEATEVLLDHCLAKDPAQRFPDAAALRGALKTAHAALGSDHPTLLRAVATLTTYLNAREVGAPVMTPATPATPGLALATPIAVVSARLAAPPALSPVPGRLPEGATPVSPAFPPPVEPTAGKSGNLPYMPATAKRKPRGALALAAAALVTVGGFLAWQFWPATPAVQSWPATPEVRPGSPPEPAPVLGQTTRELAQREREFQKLLDEAGELLTKNDPAAALVKLRAAEEKGRPDAAKGWPDLLANVSPALDARRKEAEKLVALAADPARADALRAQARLEARRIEFQDAAAKLERDIVEAKDPLAPRLKTLCSKYAYGSPAATEAELAYRSGQALLDRDPAQACQKFERAEETLKSIAAWRESGEKVLREGVAADAALTATQDGLHHEERPLFRQVAEMLTEASTALDAGDAAGAAGALTRATAAREDALRAITARREAQAALAAAEPFAVVQKYADPVAEAKGTVKTADAEMVAGAFGQALMHYTDAKGAFSGVVAQEQYDAAQLVKTANYQQAAGMYDAALESLDQLLRFDPGHAEAKRLRQAVEQARQAAAPEVQYQKAMQDGRTALAGRNWGAAEAAFKDALLKAGHANDPVAKQGLADATMGRNAAAYLAAMADAQACLARQDMLGALAAYRQATLVPGHENDAAAQQGWVDVGCLLAVKEGEAKLEGKDYAGAEAAFRRALQAPGHQNDDAAKQGLANVALSRALGQAAVAPRVPAESTAAQQERLAREQLQKAQLARDEVQVKALMTEGSRKLALGDLDGAEMAFRLALQMPGHENDAAAKKGLELVASRRALDHAAVAPPVPAEPTPAAGGKAAPPGPPARNWGAWETLGTFAVYANRPAQGIPLDKDGHVLPIPGELDKDQLDEVLKNQRGIMTLEEGVKVRVEATGRWFSGPTGQWVGADGMKPDGQNTLKSFRAFPGPNDSFGIAKLVMFVWDKEKPTTPAFQQLAQKGWYWGYSGAPLEFVMPARGVLRFQQNRDGYYDVTQGALQVTVQIAKPLK